MELAIVSTLFISGVIGFVFGRASMRMTMPASGAFQLYSPVFSAIIGLVLGFIAGLFGFGFIGMLYGAVLGAVVASTITSLVRKFGL